MLSHVELEVDDLDWVVTRMKAESAAELPSKTTGLIALIACFSIGSRPSDHYFRSVCWFVCLFVCAEFFSAVFDPISIKLGHMLYVWV